MPDVFRGREILLKALWSAGEITGGGDGVWYDQSHFSGVEELFVRAIKTVFRVFGSQENRLNSFAT